MAGLAQEPASRTVDFKASPAEAARPADERRKEIPRR
jgi:cytolysin (calcineurin-like family phosphatase)